ncbi:TlpA family protein disulfide reductase [Ktedonospora formicarum]|uniref:Thioredoxin domain-containing protein n=1 Tax=Ktedonospora formicarum TaxID=2778364 RepID=A0A8J3MRK5_9CHLR|nr:TlpA disulfide reductase family protein [Ktedonospora formicarum]GHO43708.1 hypothetical protein KSX_18710 [Ktedonospora formicarum]
MASENIKLADTAMPEEYVDKAMEGRKRRRRIITFSVVTVINIALLALLFTQLLTPASGAKNTASSNTTTGAMTSPLIGKTAPDFTLSSLSDGKTVHLSDFKGKPVLLNFWASWCEPCQAEAPLLSKTWQQVQSKGVVMLGVDSNEPSSDAHKFLQKYGLSYTNVQDTLNGDTGVNYGIRGYPETFFIDASGKVVARYGPLDTKGLQSELKKLGIA